MTRVLRLLPVLALAIGTVALVAPATATAAPQTWSGTAGTNGYTWSN